MVRIEKRSPSINATRTDKRPGPNTGMSRTERSALTPESLIRIDTDGVIAVVLCAQASLKHADVGEDVVVVTDVVARRRLDRAVVKLDIAAKVRRVLLHLALGQVLGVERERDKDENFGHGSGPHARTIFAAPAGANSSWHFGQCSDTSPRSSKSTVT